MRRADFDHVVHAAAKIVEDEIVVIGSQAILGSHPDAPEELLRSAEVDLYPRNDPDRAHEIDGAIGDGSQFHAMYGYYAHGVGPETATAPAGWEQRLIRVEVPARGSDPEPVIAWCLEAHDLVLAKLARGSEADMAFAGEAVRSELVDSEQLLMGVDQMPDGHGTAVRKRLAGLLARLDASG